MDYGYIIDVEVDSDDEEEEEDIAEAGIREEKALNGPLRTPPGEDNAEQDRETSTPEKAEEKVDTGAAAGEGEEGVISAPPAPAPGAAGVVKETASARENSGARNQPRFAPKRMFMDEVNLRMARHRGCKDVCAECRDGFEPSSGLRFWQ